MLHQHYVHEALQFNSVWYRFAMRPHLPQSGSATRVVGFDKCFLEHSFGLVGRAAAQPGQVAHSGSNFQENIHEIILLESSHHSVPVCTLSVDLQNCSYRAFHDLEIGCENYFFKHCAGCLERKDNQQVGIFSNPTFEGPCAVQISETWPEVGVCLTAFLW